MSHRDFSAQDFHGLGFFRDEFVAGDLQHLLCVVGQLQTLNNLPILILANGHWKKFQVYVTKQFFKSKIFLKLVCLRIDTFQIALFHVRILTSL
jgi:hypothetical protein